jgi:hypothetical protein
MLSRILNRSKLLYEKYGEPIYGFGMISSAVAGSSYGGWRSMNELKNKDMIETTAVTTCGVVAGGIAGLVGWICAPVILTVASAVYIHKKTTD